MGRKQTEQTKRKISIAMKNRIFTLETRKKLSEKAKNRSQEHKIKLGLSHKKKAWNWKDKKVKYRGLHEWIVNNIGLPKICEDCGSIKNIDIANITGIYNRDFINWKYLCRKCHMKSDGRYKDLLKRNKRRIYV